MLSATGPHSASVYPRGMDAPFPEVDLKASCLPNLESCDNRSYRLCGQRLDHFQ